MIFENIKFYNSEIENLTIEEGNLQKKFDQLSWMRLAIVLGALVLVYFGFKMHIFIGIGAIVVVIALFIGVILYQIKIGRIWTEKKELISIYRNELSEKNTLFSNQVSSVSLSHPFAFDLDVFGDFSLFSDINRTVTSEGRNKLIQALSTLDKTKSEIVKTQEISRKCAERRIFRFQFLRGIFFDKKNEKEVSVQQWLDHVKFVFSEIRGLEFYTRISPFLILVSGISAFFLPKLLVIVVLLLLTNLFLSIQFKMRSNRLTEYISRSDAVLGKYVYLANLIKEESFDQWEIDFLELEKINDVFAFRLQNLEKLIRLSDYKYNGIVGPILDILFVWDIRISIAIEKWIMKNKPMVVESINSIGIVDLVVTLGTFRFNHENYNYPQIVEDQYGMKGKGIGHPLIKSEGVVVNDYVIEGRGKFDLVTGSNMAGKSTFLRSLGLNVVLALNGLPVFAESFEVYANLRLFTAMRSMDSLGDNLSSFHAEINRLERAITTTKGNKDTFLLLDEILKGTNSQDRHKGSKALIKQFVRDEISGILATHDLQLTALEKEFPQHVRNYHFTITNTQDGELYFDYKIKEGVCQNFNATQLMKRIGVEMED